MDFYNPMDSLELDLMSGGFDGKKIAGEISRDARLNASTDSIDSFFEKLECQVGRGVSLSKAERAELLGLDLEELEKREATPVAKAALAIDPILLERGGPQMRKAAGYLSHVYKKSQTLQEALEHAAELVSDDATPEQWRLLAKARAALDISGFLQILTAIFAKSPV